jgi:hypothetical protein
VFAFCEGAASLTLAQWNPVGDWFSWSDLQQLLDPDTLRRLLPHLTHTGLDGEPCVEAERLAEWLELLDPPRVSGPEDAPEGGAL